MTAAELIEELKKVPEETRIITYNPEMYPVDIFFARFTDEPRCVGYIKGTPGPFMLLDWR